MLGMIYCNKRHTLLRSIFTRWLFTNNLLRVTFFACLRTHFPTCLACSRAHVPYVLTRSRVNVPCMSTCSHTITSNNKNKLSVKFSTQIFGTFSLSFSCVIKLYMKSARQAGMSLEASTLRIQQCIPAFLLPGRSL